MGSQNISPYACMFIERIAVAQICSETELLIYFYA